MSGGIAYVWDVDGSFSSKCNRETVELCSVEDKDDLQLVNTLLEEFKALTGSVIAETLLNEFKERVKEFVKVFPYEYQRVIKQKAVTVEAVVKTQQNSVGINDIEDAVADITLEKKKAERALDKLRGNAVFFSFNGPTFPCSF